MKRVARSLPLVARVLAVLSVLASCSSPSPMQPVDAGPPDMGVGAVDAGPITPMWTSGPDYPTPIAFGAAMILPNPDGFAYLYVIGGSGGSFSRVLPTYAQIRRSQIQADNSLGPWQSAGNISTGSMNYPLGGHGAIRVFSDDMPPIVGIAVAGGGGPTGLLPLVLAGYAQPDGSMGMWGSFAPRISAAQGGVLFGSFNSFEAHQLALVGGLQGTMPTNHVLVAATGAGTMVPTWHDGPMLPAARFGHSTVPVGMAGAPADLYVIGGANTAGPIADVVVTVRDAATLSVNGWATAGSLTEPVAFPQTALVGNHVYVMGGIPGDPALTDPTAHVWMATAAHGGATATLGGFMQVGRGSLPAGRAGGLVASIGPWVYIVGGVIGSPATASPSVIYARMER